MPCPSLSRLLLLLATTVISIHAQTVQRDIPFAQVGEHDLALDLYLPESPAKGVIVWVHGGAWRGGSKAGVDLRDMTEQGWALASVDYRLSGDAPFPAQIHDIKAAIRFLRASAGTLQIPTTPFVISGSSAGGHLAAEVGVTNGHPDLEGTVGDHLEQDSSVQAIVDLFGASNFMTILKQSTPHGLNVRKPALDLFITGQPEDVPEIAKLASPVFHVDANDPPLYLSHGDQDPQMPINQAHEMHGAYKAHGLPVHFEVMHGSAHGGPAFSSPEERARIDAFLTEHLEL